MSKTTVAAVVNPIYESTICRRLSVFAVLFKFFILTSLKGVLYYITIHNSNNNNSNNNVLNYYQLFSWNRHRVCDTI